MEWALLACAVICTALMAYAWLVEEVRFEGDYAFGVRFNLPAVALLVAAAAVTWTLFVVDKVG